MNGKWVHPDVRDSVIDYISYWSNRTQMAVSKLVNWLGISRSKYNDWRVRYGKVNVHNSLIPRDFWLADWEKEAIIKYYQEHPLEGYRRLTYMMMDADIVAVSPSSVYRVLKNAGLIGDKKQKPSKKGTGFQQPIGPHKHWHVDVAYLNICGTFYYLCSILDGYSRYIVHWEIRTSMTEADVEIILQRAHEKFPDERPRVISDNGPQFIAKDFKEFIRIRCMSHVKTSPYYPQSNGKIERWHKTLKNDCIRPKTPQTLEEAREIVKKFVDEYNNVRLHSAIEYVTPKDKLDGLEKMILKSREEKLANARNARIELYGKQTEIAAQLN